MSTAEMKHELHLLIENADSELLELMYSILSKTENELALNEIQVAELERRYEDHIKNPSEGSTWDEVKARISKKSK